MPPADKFFNLLSKRDHFDIAARDVNMAVEPFVLALLAGMKSGSREAGEELDGGTRLAA